MLFLIVVVAWLAGVMTSFSNGNRKFPLSVFLIGAGLTIAQFTIGLGFGYLALMAILAAVMWTANNLE